MGACLGTSQHDFSTHDSDDDLYVPPMPSPMNYRKLSTGPPIPSQYSRKVHRRFQRRMPELAMARGMPMERPQMTPVHKHIVMESWNLIRPNMSMIVIGMFNELFVALPIVREAFFKGFQTIVAEATQEREQTVLEHHAEKMTEVFDKIIGLMQARDVGSLEEYIHEIGDKHATVSLRLEYMDCAIPFFVMAMRPCLKQKWANTIEDAWAQFLRRVIHIMKESMAF